MKLVCLNCFSWTLLHVYVSLQAAILIKPAQSLYGVATALRLRDYAGISNDYALAVLTRLSPVQRPAIAISDVMYASIWNGAVVKKVRGTSFSCILNQHSHHELLLKIHSRSVDPQKLCGVRECVRSLSSY